MIETLIDKVDNCELIRDKIAQILTDESVSQMQLATTAGKDPSLWELRVFIERSNVFEMFTPNAPAQPVVLNVWYDTSTFLTGAGNSHEKQQCEGIFNIDIYGHGVSRNVDGGGHEAGDKAAAIAAQRGSRLVRNILMSAEYVQLGLMGIVGSRWPQSISLFQPLQGETSAQQIVSARVVLRVVYNEFSPQHVPTILTGVTVEIFQAEDGQLLSTIEG